MTAKYENMAIHAGLYRENQIFVSCKANLKMEYGACFQ